MTAISNESDLEMNGAEDDRLKPESEIQRGDVQPDGGWGWVVCFTCFLCNGTVFGLTYATGILYVAIKDTFGEGQEEASSKAALVGALCIGLTFFMCFVSGIVIDKIGIKLSGVFGGILSSVGIIGSAFVGDFVLLWLTQGILLGIGLAFIFSTSMVILSHYFKRRIGLAYGIVTVGGNVFGLILSLGLEPLLEGIGFRYTMLVLSSLTLMAIPCAMTWTPLLPGTIRQRYQFGSSTSKSYSARQQCLRGLSRIIDVALFRKKYYLILILTQVLHYTAYSTMLVHLVNYMKEAFPDKNHSLVITYISIAGALAQICVGRLVDTKYASQVTMMSLAHGIYGLIVVCIPWVPNYVIVVIMILLMGVGQGMFTCLTGPLTVTLGGSEHASQAFGFVLGMVSLPTASFPPLVGYLYDKMGHYDVAFHVVGCLPIVAMILMCNVPKTGG